MGKKTLRRFKKIEICAYPKDDSACPFLKNGCKFNAIVSITCHDSFSKCHVFKIAEINKKLKSKIDTIWACTSIFEVFDILKSIESDPSFNQF